MGFTALDGLPMGTRPGQLDPGVVLYLIEQKRHDAPRRCRTCSTSDCGLKGLSGISNDMRELLASDDPRARLCASTTSSTGSACNAGMLAAALGGLDAFVFTAGIGENSAPIRARIAEAPRLARRRARPGRQRRRSAADLGTGKPGRRLRHPDRRRTDDRAPHAGALVSADRAACTWKRTHR